MRTIAALVAVVAIAFLAYRHYHQGLSVNTGRDNPLAVLVAKRAIPKGLSGFDIAELRLYTVRMVRASLIPTEAVLSPSALTRKVTVTKIPAGAELTSSYFGPPSP